MKLRRIISFLFICILLLSACAETNETGTTLPQETDISGIPEIISYNYYRSEFLHTTPDEKAYGTDVKCTAMQGMAASEAFIYTAKQKDEKYCNIYQYSLQTGKQKLMTYYPGPLADTPAAVDTIAHCNDMDIYDDADGTRYLLAATAQTPDSLPGITCLVRFALDEDNAVIRPAGYYDLIHYNQWGGKEYIPAGSVRKVSEDAEYHYFLVKYHSQFLWFKIPVNDPGGSRKAAVELECVEIFTIVNRNALFANNIGQTFTVQNLESWTNQGFGYSFADDMLYIPMYNARIGSSATFENVIVTYKMDGMLTPGNISKVTEDRDMMLHPTNLSFYLADPAGKFFEVESCVFLLNQGEDGDHRLYFNTNAGDVKKAEGIWVTEYTEGSANVQSIASENSIVYTVDYHYNVFAMDRSQWKTDAPSHHFNMVPTVHIAGIRTALRINTFVRSGYEFTGWYLHRQSDDTWLCSDGNWYPEDSIPAGAGKQLLQDTESVDNLTGVNGDLITAYAQWAKK